VENEIASAKFRNGMRAEDRRIAVPADELKFGEWFRCKQCGRKLHIPYYLESPSVLSIPPTVGLLWLLQVRGLWLYLLLLPTAVALFVIMVRLRVRFSPAELDAI
jgi:hypothetical protein